MSIGDWRASLPQGGDRLRDIPDLSVDLLEKFHDYLEVERSASPHTLRAYMGDISELLEYLSRAGRGVADTDTAELRSFFMERTGINFDGRHNASANGQLERESDRRRLGARSQGRKLAAIRHFFDFLFRRDLIAANPAASLPTPRYFRALPARVPVTDLQSILDQRPANAEQGGRTEALRTRDVAICEMLYSSGMRISELLSLCLGDLHADRSTLKVTGKGDKERLVFLGPEARRALAAYLEHRGLLSSDREHEAPLLVNSRGGRLTARGVRYRMKQMAAELGLRTGVTPHQFRHSFATDLMNSGADLRAVQELLGHSRPTTTQAYTHVSKDRLREIYRNAHPHARDTDAE